MKLMRVFLAGLGIWAFLFLSGAGAVEQLFDSWRLYPVSKKPSCVFSVDIDGDGDLDLVVSHIQTDITGDNPVVILKNNGAGFFSRDTTLYTSGSPRQVVVRDLDGDGDMDILTVNPGSSRVSIFKNRGGNRGFELPIDCPVGRQPLSVLTDFIDADSTPDILTANYFTGTASLLINHGAAAFPAETTKFLGVGPRSAAVIDFDNDGDKDLAVSVSAEPLDRKIGINGIVVMENDTFPNGKSGAFNDSNRVFFKIPSATDTTKADTLYNPMQLVAADFNGDGYLDLALADSAVFNQPTRAAVSIFMNRFSTEGGLNSRTFAPPVPYRVGIECRSIFVADLDNDGDLDIAAANSKDGTVSILKNSGNGTFPAKTDFLSPVVPYWVDGGDYDRDGDVDLALASYAGAAVAVLRNRGNGTFEVGSEYTTGTFSNPQGVAAGDLDADGDIDLAVGNLVTNQISIHLNGNGTFPATPSGILFSGNPRALALVDLDGDGDKDIAAANQSSRTVSIFKNNGNATFQAGVIYTIGNVLYSIVARDLDNDSDVDLATVSPTTNHEFVYVLKNNGDGTFAPPDSFPTGKISIFITSADFNGDGFYDLATVDQNFGPFFDSVSILFNDGTGAFSPRVSQVVGSSPTSMATGDFDADGDVDWAVTNSGDTERGDSSVMVFMNNGNGTFAPRIRYQTGGGPVAVLAVDMDGDGDLDIITADSASNAVAFLANNGSGTFAPAVEFAAGPNPRGLAAVYLDTDGDLDLAVTNISTIATFPVNVQPDIGAFTVLKNLSITPCFARGDLNGDNLYTLVDITLELNCVFLSIGACPLCVADANCDTRLSTVDLSVLLQAVFLGGGLSCP